MYFYFIRYLIERVSWYCRDNFRDGDGGDGTCQLAFSNRSGVSYSEMANYLGLLKKYPITYGVRIHWDAIHPVIKVRQHDQLNGLQIADAVASGMRYAVDPNRHGNTEPRYSVIFRPITYKRGRYRSYGVKIFPTSVETELAGDERTREFAETYL